MSRSAVLFDFDGTLADTIPLIVASYRHTLTAPDQPAPTEAVIRSWIGRPLLETLEAHRPGEGALLVDRYREHSTAHHDTLIAVVPGAADLVTALQERQVPVGVVSSKRADMVRHGMRVTELPHVDVVVGLLETTAHKPDPAPLLEGARRLGIDPADCVYVGDAVVDVQAAHAAGMAAVAVTWGAGEEDALRALAPDAVARDVDELRTALTGLLELDGGSSAPTS
ncbi:HAD family hydrolase [Ornithinimicrobium sufpigmenti]|uniref:HAD family hydrolase n=1 Tax=Ornithinimicrobium sufpigmenti TaxID=2508882 RepID=UPI001035AB23|nr:MULTISPECIES: HAD-IA family hydrolase [unclassified Ornithinimicrobium]